MPPSGPTVGRKRPRKGPVRQRLDSRGSCYRTDTLGHKSTLLIFSGIRQSSGRAQGSGVSAGMDAATQVGAAIGGRVGRTATPSSPFLHRRLVIGLVMGLAMGLLPSLCGSPKALAFGGRDRIELAQLEWPGSGAAGSGGASSPESSGGTASQSRPDALRRLLWEIEKRTAIEVNPEAVTVRLSELGELHRHPLIYLAGDRAFPMPSDEDLARLRRYLVMGGMLIIDSAEGRAGGAFDQSVRQLTSRLFPNRALSRLSEDHVLFRAFYLLRVPAGRIIAQPYIEAVLLGERERSDSKSASSEGKAEGSSEGSGEGKRDSGPRTVERADRPERAERPDTAPLSESRGRAVIVYSQNDLGGAWARDRFGQWVHEVVPGGETQREHAFRLGVNLAMYALCLDYKADQVHVPFIMRRRMWQAPAPKINFEGSSRSYLSPGPGPTSPAPAPSPSTSPPPAGTPGAAGGSEH